MSLGRAYWGGPAPFFGFCQTVCTIIVNASVRPPRLAGLPTVGACNYGYTGI